ncbi:PREDICTED: rho guanine nucleotide exchange factor 37 [Tinamus guttatus]|uniref:rho guanine nucleotide exchange factor 37 n=1 Tax=Tinamus guttatus TaxID=94827 RepID=UPI00052EB67E|nr:PREDICTED: rho guanine nucleotide exchange factor 37 [Tinamus guttatus]
MASSDTSEPECSLCEEVLPDERRRLAVEELLATEASYVHNLQLCMSDIRAHLQHKQLPDLDLEGLFSNTDDILHVSRRFLEGLKAAADQESEQLLFICALFQEFKEEMETVYKIYCASYEHALMLVESYRKDPRLQEEILDTLNTTVASFPSHLVCPAPGAATKYNKAEHLSLRDRLARLNTHSIAKKTTRLSRLFMHETGIASKTEDKEYDDLEEKFQCVASSITALKENVGSYLKHLEAFQLSTPHKHELQIDEGAAQQYRCFAERLHRSVLPEFRQRLDRLVCQPLSQPFCSLSDMLVGPQQLVKKRLDKLLDYEEIQERKSELGSVTYDEEAAMNTYLAINALLVAELPRFNQVALQLLGQILCSFTVLQRDLATQVLQEAEKELEQMPHSHMPLPSFWKLMEDTLQQSGAQLHTFCQKFEMVMPSPVAQPLTPAEERKVHSLVSRHGPDKLYQVTSNISGSKDLDLTLQRGQIVALLQSMDTKGNTSRWLVDAGGPRGFVPAAKLQPYCPVPKEQPRMQVPALECGMERRRHSYALPEAPRAPVSTFAPAFQVVAGFSFVARSPHEVSVQAGQPVLVLEPHDKKGSKEWSLVDVNGQKGYVPSSYLVTVPVEKPLGWSLPV